MDYSASIHEADDPAGASPWGNSPSSSPRQTRSGFGGIAGEPPSSPFPYNSQSSGGLEQDDTDGHDQSGITTATTTQSETETENSGDAIHGGFSAPTQHQTAASEQAEEQTPFSPRQPSHGQPPNDQEQPAKPQQPQYRLQAKITGLERTGKKDPLLRFDVYVCRSCLRLWPRTNHVDQPSPLPNNAIPRCASPAFRIRQTCRPPHLCEP